MSMYTGIVFKVKACNDAHVILSSMADYQDGNYYHIIIGGWDNEKSAIK